MQILTKKEIDAFLGTYSMFDIKSNANHLIHKLKYVGGISDLDDLRHKGKVDTDVWPINLRTRPRGLEIELTTGVIKSLRFALPLDRFIFWTIEHRDDLQGDTSKSIVGRAAVGGVFFGKLGGLAGAMSGMLDKPSHALLLVHKGDDVDDVILLSATSTDAGKVYDYMIKNFPAKYQSITEHAESVSASESGSNTQSVAEEIRKLADLHHTGVLTQDEFDSLKKKLLS